MNFAPYQSSPPESTRGNSPPQSRSATASPVPKHPALEHTRARASTEDPWAAVRGNSLPSPSAFTERGYDDLEANNVPSSRGWGAGADVVGAAGDGHGGWGYTRGGVGGLGGETDGAYVFETSLGIRMDVEAALAYLLVPPLGGVVLLVFEHKSDYVRFHAWQSSLVFAALFILHLVFSWSSFFSWLLFIVDLALIAFMVFRAYRDAETLDRLELPFFGPIASRYVDLE